MALPASLVAHRTGTQLACLLPTALLAAAVLLGMARPGHASEPPEPGSAAALLDRAFKNLYAEDYIQTLVLATQSRGGREMQRRLQLIRRQSVRPGRALLRFLYPEPIRRTSVLILENDGASDDLYVYLPALQMTRRLSSAQKADSFFGSDLSYEDVEPKHVEDFVVRWVDPDAPASDADSASGSADDCVKVRITAAPGFESGYDEQISCIDPERGVIRWTDYYVSGRHLKRLTIDPKEIRQIGERSIPFLVTIETPRNRSVTKVITESYELVSEIPEKIFATWNLTAGDARSDRRKMKTSDPAEEDGAAGQAPESDEGDSSE